MTLTDDSKNIIAELNRDADEPGEPMDVAEYAAIMAEEFDSVRYWLTAKGYAATTEGASE